MRRVGRALFEPLGAFCVSSDTCYISSGEDLVVYDVRDELSPFFVTSRRLPATTVRDIASSGPFLYVTTYSGGFWILDKANDYAPLGTYLPEASMRGSFFEEGRAYLVCLDGLHIVDLSDPMKPQLLGRYSRDGGIGMPYVTGDTCYATCSMYGLVILDVSDPSHILELDSLEIADYAYSMAMLDTLACVTGYHHLTVVDVSDLHDIVQVGRMELEYSSGTTLVPLLIYSHYAMVTVWGSSNVEGGFHFIDISDPSAMEEELHYPVDYLTDAAIVSPFIYTTNGEGMKIVDFSNPQEPREVGVLDGNHFLQSVDVSGDYAYVCDYQGGGAFHILDVSEKAFPKPVNTLPLEGAYDVFIDYPGAYVASVTDGFYILDVSDPEGVITLGHIDIDARGVFIKYPYAFLAIDAVERDGLKILDISRPDSIVELGYFPIFITDEVFVQDSLAYVASSFDGVYIIDVSDPENPVSLSRFPTLDMATDVHVSGHYLYVAAGYAGVSVVDVSDPQHPVEVAYSLAGYGNQIHVVEPYLYLAGGSYGMKVLDISVPNSIHEVGHYGIASLGGIYADEEYIYYGTIDNGFYIFEFSPTGIISDDEGPVEIPRTFALYQNYPNPFNPTTTISFEVPGTGGSAERVSLNVYDIRGRRVKTLVDSSLQPGRHKAVWDGRNEERVPVSSGLYLYTLKTSNTAISRKMVMVK